MIGAIDAVGVGGQAWRKQKQGCKQGNPSNALQVCNAETKLHTAVHSVGWFILFQPMQREAFGPVRSSEILERQIFDRGSGTRHSPTQSVQRPASCASRKSRNTATRLELRNSSG